MPRELVRVSACHGRTFTIRRPGAVRGRRLFDCESIRNFLNSCADHGAENQEGGAE